MCIHVIVTPSIGTFTSTQEPRILTRRSSGENIDGGVSRLSDSDAEVWAEKKKKKKRNGNRKSDNGMDRRERAPLWHHLWGCAISRSRSMSPPRSLPTQYVQVDCTSAPHSSYMGALCLAEDPSDKCIFRGHGCGHKWSSVTGGIS